MANATTLKLGAWSTLTDTFVAHPNSPTGAIYDLNDQANWTIVDAQEGFGTGLEITPPRPEVLKSGNSRAIGERVTRRNYSHNRTIRVNLLQLPQSTQAAWNASLRNLIQLCEGISPQQPAALQMQLTSSGTPVYADVLEAHVTTRYKETLFAQYVNDEVTVELECRPFLRGPRQTLQNLVTNPGFEAPSGTGVVVFSDQISNLNAYTTISGSPTLSSNNIVLPANAAVLFGSAAWGAFNTWQARFNITSGATASFYLHYVDANNYLRFDAAAGGYVLYQVVAGAATSLASGTMSLSTSLYYWISATQFPISPNANKPSVTITVNSDSSGVIGSVLTTVGPVALTSWVPTSGKMGFLAQTATANFGGFAGKATNIVSLFGPGGWMFDVFSGIASGAWDQTSANTYAGGPMLSSGAARVDAPPTGAWNVGWSNYNGGSPLASFAAPVHAVTDVLGASAWVKSSGLGASGVITLVVREWDSSGTLIRQTTLQTLTGNQASWTQLSGTLTTSGTTSFVDVLVGASDTTSGSANAMVWFDNVLCYDQTTTGQTSMPYCELRFPQSPAQVVLSGVLGDAPTPALLSVGAFFASLTNGSILTLRIGKRALPSAGWRAISNPTLSNTTPALNTNVYGGYTGAQTAQNTGASFLTTCAESDLVGIYHLLGAAACSQATANVVKNTVRISAGYLRSPAYTFLAGYNGVVLTAGFTTQNVVAIVDGGQYTVPVSARGAVVDLSTIFDNLSLQYGDPTSSSTTTTSWMALLPIDGGYLATQFVVSSGLTLTNLWLWLYNDGLATQYAQPASWRYSSEGVGLPIPANGVGGTGTTSSGYAGVNPAADAFLTLDPTTWVNGTRGVNQLLAQWNDTSGTPLPLAMELSYTPLYLWPQ